ncbi:Gfo/Idh/MocA family oxidoreductase [Rhodobacteraceae bacterium S2214]|nr:Gfo/Idh/MocA family oxidoreductase [Rhodobacteraceae bacterium S2214]
MITVAILGAGIGREHLDGYRALPDLFEVKTLCDLDRARASEVVGEDPITITDKLDLVLADPRIDLVDVCLPPHLHFPVTMQVLKAGKHAICEKPLVSSLADADSLTSTSNALNKNVYPVFQYRYGRAMSQVQSLRDAGLLGTPYAASIETHWCRRADYYAIDWRGTWAGENGGAVLGHAIHNHDLITALIGPVQSLSAFTATRANPIETEDCASISMQMVNGALVTSSITLGAADDTTRLKLTFSGVTITSGTAPYAPATDTWTFTARDPELQSAVDDVINSVGDVPQGFTGFLSAIAADLKQQPAEAVTLADGRQSIELVAAIYHAARTGTVVTLPLTEDHPLYAGWHPSKDS